MRILRHLPVQVLIGVALGIAAGLLWPSFKDAAGEAVPGLAEKFKPLGDAFVNLIKMIIAPVIFCTVAVGIARMSDLKAFGRVGLKALIYFEVVSTLALLVGWGVGEVLQPGRGINYTPNEADADAIKNYAEQASHTDVVSFFMGIIPKSFFSAFSEGVLLQVLFLAILSGIAISRMGPLGDKIADTLESISKIFFGIIGIVVRFAPLGAFGAMAFVVGKYGAQVLGNLAFMMIAFYVTAILFVVVVLGLICRLAGFSFFKLFRYIWPEFVLVFGASSSEVALPHLMQKAERLGASKSVVGLVVPTGYSFNLDGSNIYMTMAVLFLAQACNIQLSFGDMLVIFGVSLLTSMGASGVTGAGFITLIATLQAVPGHPIPIAAVALLLGIDRFMSEARGLTNFLGNAVASLVVARWDKALDMDVLHRELNAGPGRPPEPLKPAADETGPD